MMVPEFKEMIMKGCVCVCVSFLTLHHRQHITKGNFLN